MLFRSVPERFGCLAEEINHLPPTEIRTPDGPASLYRSTDQSIRELNTLIHCTEMKVLSQTVAEGVYSATASYS